MTKLWRMTEVRANEKVKQILGPDRRAEVGTAVWLEAEKTSSRVQNLLLLSVVLWHWDW